MWYYENQIFDGEKAIADGYIGFVYIITDKETNMKYIGKKKLVFEKKLPPLKGKKRKRRVLKESDWLSYYGSSETVKELVHEHGPARFHREVIRLCKSKGEMSYYELYEQLIRHALLKPDEYHNEYVGARIHRKHVL